MDVDVTPADKSAMRDFWEVYDAHRAEISAKLRVMLAQHAELGPLLQSMTPEQLAQQEQLSRGLQRKAVVEDDWQPYLTHLHAMGIQYAQAGIRFAAWMEVTGAARRILGPYLFAAYGETGDRLHAASGGMDKFFDGAISTIGEAYLEAKENIIRLQQRALQELSTPVLQLREGMLILPVIGVLDSQRARQLTEQLLRAIRDNRARVAVVDITGVPSVDSKVANHLLQTAEAARLMGAIVILTGLSPEVAQSLVAIGVDLSRFATVGDLQGGITEADRRLGYKVLRGDEATQAQARGV